MSPLRDRTMLNVSVAIAFLIAGGVVVRRAPAIGAGLVACGLISAYFVLAARRS